MTIDEAIKHCEEIAKDKVNLASTLWDSKEKARCEDCAEEHRKLAEWLKELKKYKEQEPCEDCISRKEVLETIKWYEENTYDYYNRLIESIQQIESVKPTGAKGKWLRIVTEKDGLNEKWHYECSECRGHGSMFGIDSYCPNCGADMRGEEN